MTTTPEHTAGAGLATSGHDDSTSTRPTHERSWFESIPAPLRYLIEAAAIYLAYNLLGDLNREFTPPPIGISPIWLPAGFAVGVVLVRGWWTTIPLFLTGFVNTVRADWALTDPVGAGGFGLDGSTILWAATLYGLAIISHCVVAKLLVDRIRDRSFEGVWPAFAFLMAVGPVSCVASALIGTEVFRVEGFVTSDGFAVSAFTFWIGDTIACMLIAPVFVAAFGGRAWRGRRTAIVVLTVATAAIVLASTGLVGRTELDRVRQSFERSATRAAAVFEARTRRLENVALDQAALLSAAPELTEDEFVSAARDRLDRSEGAQLLGWLQSPDGALERTRVVAAAGAGDDADDFVESFIVDPIEPMLRVARDEGTAVWVPRGDDEGATDDFVYAPTYAGVVDVDSLTPAQRRERLSGFVAVRTDLDASLAAATDAVIDDEAAAVVRSERSPDALVLAAQPSRENNPLVDDRLSPLAAARTKGVPFASSRTFDLDTNPWSVTFAPSRSYVTDTSFLVTILPASLIALAFSLTIMLLALTSTGQRTRLRRLVRVRTRALEASEQRYRSVVDNVREAIFQLDPAGRITFVSAAWDDDLSAGGRDRAPGAMLVDTLRIADRTRLERTLELARSHPGDTFTQEFESADRRRVLEIRIASPLATPGDDDLEPPGAIVGLVVDVTDQREVLRNRERFISLVAHELRNPLTVISGSVATIGAHERDELPPLSAKLLPAVQTAAHRLDRIISDLLVSSQVDAGTLTLQPEPTDLRRVVRQSVEAAQLNAREHGVTLEAHGLDEPLSLTCDVDRVSQVVDNLLSNAIKYTPGGGTVTVNVAVADDGRTARVEVEDSGIGIAPEDRDRIFERYGRTVQGTIVAPGTGLGLAICRSIAETHGGTIELESTIGVGSTFTLVLPMR